jgi:choline kinase
MKAIILAAGRGSRMKELTDEVPKCLVKYRGKELLEWQLTALREAGITEVAIVTGYKRELLAKRADKEFFNPRWAETNMVSSLACASEWLRSEPCIISYSDLYYKAKAIKILMDRPDDLAITFDLNWRKLWEKRFGNPLLDAESFRLNEKGHLKEIGNKPKTVEEIEGQYMGILKFSPAGWEEIERIRKGFDSTTQDKTHMTGTLQQVLNAGRLSIKAVPYDGEWGEFDSLSDIENSQ